MKSIIPRSMQLFFKQLARHKVGKEITILVLITGCAHKEISPAPALDKSPRTLNAAFVHKEMPAKWMLNNWKEPFYAIIKLDTNGDLFVANGGEAPHWIGTWKIQEPGEFVTNQFGRSEFEALTNLGSYLYITYGKPSATNCREGIYPVIYVDDHELILQGGIDDGEQFQFTR